MTALLVRISGRDQTGINAGVLEILDQSAARLIDMEQVVVRDRIHCGMLIEIDEERSPLKELLYFGWQKGVSVEFEIVESVDVGPLPPRFAVTVMGSSLAPGAVAGVANAVSDSGGNIERISQLSRYPVVSYEMLVVGGDLEAMRAALLRASHEHLVDVAIQAEGLARRAKRLVVIDMDSTLVQDEVIDLLAAEAGVADEVAELTRLAMEGATDYGTALRDRVALLAGTPEDVLERVAAKIRLTPGARTFVRTLRRLGYTTAVVSGGFQYFADHVKEQIGLDHAFANTLEREGGVLTGNLEGRLIDGPGKAAILAEIAASEHIGLEQTVAVGDGANDLEMLSAAGLGIAFNAKPAAVAAADTSVNVPYLDALLFILGIRRDDIEEADRRDGHDGGYPAV